MALVKKDAFLWEESAFRLIGKEKLLIVAAGERPNAMTASWGGFGVLWDRPTVYLWVRPERYTYGLLQKQQRFSVCILPDGSEEVYRLCGSVSGAEQDKFALCHLTAAWQGETPYIAESRAVLLCRGLYRQPMMPDGFWDPALLRETRQKGSLHTLFAAEITSLLLAE